MFTCQYNAFLLDDCVKLFYTIIMFFCVFMELMKSLYYSIIFLVLIFNIKKERYIVIAITIATFKQPISTTNQQFPTFLFISSFASIKVRFLCSSLLVLSVFMDCNCSPTCVFWPPFWSLHRVLCSEFDYVGFDFLTQFLFSQKGCCFFVVGVFWFKMFPLFCFVL